DMAPCQSCQFEVMVDMGAFGFLSAQELATGREIEKELTNLNARARRRARGFHFEDLASADDDLGALGSRPLALARDESKSAHAGDARQGLSAKTHRRDRGQILRALDFARRMAFEAQQRVVSA